MTVEFNWFLPTSGDGRHLKDNTSIAGVRDHARREPTPDYLVQIARAAEAVGFHAALIPTGAACEDGWLTAAALAQETQWLKFLVAFRPGLELPAYAAQKVASLQEFTAGRVLLNVVTGGDQDQQEAYGDFLDHDTRYARTAEFLNVAHRAWQGPGQHYDGQYFRLENGGLREPLNVTPAVYFGGASAAAEQVAAQHADVYLLWGETPEMVRERLARMQALAKAHGRSLRYGIRLHIIARPTDGEAWAEADRLWRALTPQTIERARTALSASQSVGQARMLGLNAGKTVQQVRDLEIAPNLWAGVGLVRGGAGTALVGSYQQVADRLSEYRDLGIDTFILSGYPNLEEAWRVGENVIGRVH
ncbi:LLM class flavin-dependent oxidoreductase [Bordetella sp. 02P26C-1]|uniref:LLM class flavin-dependent oxidoreductase n=1 Tax=Bordetella sp. 02P26C-1 TaxID=2683195 RepID=UPI00135585FA|nr:LLM class flavin-dependent oxidoreductase [Bordetella sp. 02P26C-1]MVW79827.1 LLM class flavin-dependent oxidoreductase [Bordetella sp. 02P26C-1]